jgi:uncharacterized linocin/CFP29 family protein
MSLLRRHVAPLAPEAWDEIEDAVRDVLMPCLIGRRVVDLDGPHGLDKAAVGLGRLEVPKKGNDGPVGFGVHRVQPLVEARAVFELGLWELDNLARGAKDVDLGPAEQAARDLASFEDGAIFNGFEAGGITGLTQLDEHEPIKLDLQIDAFAGAVGSAVLALRDQAIAGPYTLVLGPEASRWLDSQSCGYPLRRQIAGIFEGDILYSPVIKGGLLVSQRGGDFELTLGQDVAVGFETHTNGTARLFLTESFTFRIIEPAAVVVLKL